MSDWIQRKYPAGTEVVVFDIDHKQLENGILVHPFDVDSDDNIDPEIEMPDGKIILGFDCWWIPVQETRNALRSN